MKDERMRSDGTASLANQSTGIGSTRLTSTKSSYFRETTTPPLSSMHGGSGISNAGSLAPSRTTAIMSSGPMAIAPGSQPMYNPVLSQLEQGAYRTTGTAGTPGVVGLTHFRHVSCGAPSTATLGQINTTYTTGTGALGGYHMRQSTMQSMKGNDYPRTEYRDYPREYPRTEYRDHNGRTTLGGHILREEVVEHEVRLPRKRMVEETVEKIVVVPEKVTREEVVFESRMVRERIIEIARPIIQEKLVEVPQYEYVDKIVEYPETVVQEKIREVPRIIEVDKLVYVPKIIVQERIVEVPQYEYHDVLTEKIVEVPEIRTEIKLVEKPVTQYVEVPVPQVEDVEVVEDIERYVPVPVEYIKTIQYKLPKLKAQYEKVPMPVYFPRFVEVAIPSDQMTDDSIIVAEHAVQQVALAAASGAPSLCEIETLAENIRRFVPELRDSVESITVKLTRQAPDMLRYNPYQVPMAPMGPMGPMGPARDARDLRDSITH